MFLLKGHSGQPVSHVTFLLNGHLGQPVSYCLALFEGLPNRPMVTLPPGPNILLNPREETCSVLVYSTSLHMNRSVIDIQTYHVMTHQEISLLNRV